MAIRCAAKAILMEDGHVLLNQCRDENGQIYYDLPGGGQHPYETMADAVVREVMEETGLSVRVLRLAAIAEEIYTDPRLRAECPDYTHRIHHIFLVERLCDAAAQPEPADRFVSAEPDFEQESSEWVALDALEGLDIRPASLGARIGEILDDKGAVDLGCVMVK